MLRLFSFISVILLAYSYLCFFFSTKGIGELVLLLTRTRIYELCKSFSFSFFCFWQTRPTNYQLYRSLWVVHFLIKALESHTLISQMGKLDCFFFFFLKPINNIKFCNVWKPVEDYIKMIIETWKWKCNSTIVLWFSQVYIIILISSLAGFRRNV